ncbi:MAG TPA: acyl-CoA dehydrogenase family protein [candidate division Zixibacteria bacterium]|nr:acyl-CoA dehydrogenase family protein [candidate division Zixibacteria bacterium]
MDLSLTETQEMFKKVASDFVKAEVPAHLMTRWYKDKETFQPRLFRKAVELGWVGMMLPEQYGGAAMSAMDCGVVFEELGRGPVPGPLFSSGVLAAQAIFEAGTDEQKQALLPAICKGESIVIPAINDKASSWGPESVETRLVKTPDGYLMSGTKRFVFDAQAATSFLCAARTEEGQVVFVLIDAKSPGVTVTPLVGFLVSAAEVRFDRVRIPASALLGAGGSDWRTFDAALEKSLPILCAYQVGASQEVFDITCEYTRTRVVFGQPIGRFQRVQDHCVEISIHLDAARWATYETLWRLDTGIPARAAVHEAKAVASEGYYQATNYAHMVWAGPGTDYGHPMMAHSVLAHTLYQYLGTPAQHKRLMMDTLYPVS